MSGSETWSASGPRTLKFAPSAHNERAQQITRTPLCTWASSLRRRAYAGIPPPSDDIGKDARNLGDQGGCPETAKPVGQKFLANPGTL